MSWGLNSHPSAVMRQTSAQPLWKAKMGDFFFNFISSAVWEEHYSVWLPVLLQGQRRLLVKLLFFLAFIHVFPPSICS